MEFPKAFEVGQVVRLAEDLDYRSEKQGTEVTVVEILPDGPDWLYVVEMPDGSREYFFDTILEARS